jgi:multiple sugar transport system permease protein
MNRTADNYGTQKGGKTIWYSEKFIGYIFLAPFLVIAFGLVGFPWIMGIYMSFTTERIGKVGEFVGFGNYWDLIRSIVFREVVFNSFFYTLFSVGLKFILGLAMALFLNQSFRGRNTIRATFLLPWVIPTALSVLVWMWMYNELFGIINFALSKIGLFPVPWLSDPTMAKISLILVNVWRGTPFFGIIFLAGLQAIPDRLYEAAKVDGASSLKMLRHITLPNLKYVIGIALIYSLIQTFSDFQLIYILTRGGPGRATHVFATYAFETVFQSMELGRGAAISIFMVPFLTIMIVLVMRFIYDK